VNVPSRQSRWASPRALRRNGVVGINARNLEILARLNRREFYPLVDDKVMTKSICARQGIPAPATYAIIERFGDIRDFPAPALVERDFVVKPSRGSGGRGVVVVVGRTHGGFETLGRVVVSDAELRYHVSTILSGLHSLGGRADRAIVEQRVLKHPAFESVAPFGTPDVRIIVCRRQPVMAMLRLPTRQSRGRANLHQGAVGVGIDMSTGITFGGVCRDRAVRVCPETGAALCGVEIPHWRQVLDISVALSGAIGLEYLGVDMVFDAQGGPLVLEANARPGLTIQIANRCGLWRRLPAALVPHST